MKWHALKHRTTLVWSGIWFSHYSVAWTISASGLSYIVQLADIKEKKRKKTWVLVGFDPGSSRTAVLRSTN